MSRSLTSPRRLTVCAAAAEIVILAAGPGTRGADPPATADVAGRGRVMDWLLAAFSGLRDARITLVGGYRVDAIQQVSPELRCIVNPRWQHTGPLGSLALSPALRAPGDTELWVCYGDIVLRPALVERMAAVRADVVLAIDSCWRDRYERRTAGALAAAEKVRLEQGRVVAVGSDLAPGHATAQFAGVLRLSAAARHGLALLLDDEDGTGPTLDRTAGLPVAIAALVADPRLQVATVDVRGDWAELDAPQDLARFVLGTKAESLARLRPLVRRSVIGAQASFILAEWHAEPERVLTDIRAALGTGPLIVRSSARTEDGWQASQAGAYRSLADVSGADAHAVAAAIDSVFASYPDRDPGHQVLVQRMLGDVTASGVVLTRTADRGAPYRVVNLDPTPGVTDGVTSGRACGLRSFTLHRSVSNFAALPAPVGAVLDATVELETLVGHDCLDLEFAVTRDGAVHVLQVRPLAAPAGREPVDEARLACVLEGARATFRALQGPRPFVCGASTVLSVMSDWNPAEIIGTKPRRLAGSLYRALVTDEVWARQRAEYGYRDVRPCPLLVELAGHPYVDVRATFTSFVPAALPDALAERLVEQALATLRAHPQLHDKVEFEVLFTCYAPDFEARASALRAAGFSPDDLDALRNALVEVTRAGVARCTRDRAPLIELEARRARIQGAAIPPLERAFLLVEDARRLGTPAFAHLARAGFVAQAILRGLVGAGCLSAAELAAGLAAVRTISGELQEDLAAHGGCESGRAALVARYGHLRPGTYEITSPCYAAQPEDFFLAGQGPGRATSAHGMPIEPTLPPSTGAPRAAHAWGPDVRARVHAALASSPLALDGDTFLDFAEQAIAGREWGKFIFTRNLSAALEAVAEFGAAHGFARGDLAHLSWSELLELRGAPCDSVPACLERASRAGRDAHALTQAVALPGIILTEDEIIAFEQRAAEPNFITQCKVRAPLCRLDAQGAPRADVAGCLVVIPSADPGFDWLFAHRIAGLITRHGGANSHMAIRAAEFRLPAAIGIGELLYDRLRGAAVVELDCGSRRLEVVR